jgi:hypothetical protein
MAENFDAAYDRGDMPIKAHAETYRSIMGLFKWCALGIAALLILLTMWFCTSAGFFPGLVVALIVVVAGVVGLRGRKAPAH